MKFSDRAFWDTKWMLSLAIGILLGLSWPPLPFPFLIFPAFVLLFRLIDLCSSAREAAYWCYPAFLIWNIMATYWLMLATLAGGAAAILANAVLMTIPVMLQFKVQKRGFSPWLISFIQAAYWVGYEYLIHQWQLAWPWLTLGNAWSNATPLIQYISVTGFWGISFWLVLSCSLFYQYLKHRRRIAAILFLAVILIFPLWSFSISLFRQPDGSTETTEVVIAQPNFDSYLRYGGYHSSKNALQHLIRLTDSVRTPKTSVVIWPENAIQSGISNLDQFGKSPSYQKKKLENEASRWNASIISGATYYEYFDPSKAPPLSYHSAQNSYLPYNAALNFTPGRSVQVYRKHNLVPIVERIPYVHFLNAIDVFDWINWSQIQGYGKGNTANAFRVDHTETPALICYDSVYPGWVRKYVEKDAGFLTIITNDGWWGNTSGHWQHFAYARLRAIEFDRWVARSANNGISGIIAPDGSVKAETKFDRPTSFRYQLPILHSKTFYTRFGDWLPQLMLLVSFFSIAALFFTGVDRK